MKKHNTFQQSLDKWFPRTDRDGNLIESPYKVFYLEWDAFGKPIAQWQREMPPKEKITYQTTIKWGDIQPDEVFLIGYFENFDSNSENISSVDMHKIVPGEIHYTNIAFLKSHLQKAIRRSHVGLSVKTARHMLELDLTQFLRRLAIIMIEDVYLMEEFIVLVWLTAAASKGYDLTKVQINWLYKLVEALARAKYKDYTKLELNPEIDRKTIQINKGEWKNWQLNFKDLDLKCSTGSINITPAGGAGTNYVCSPTKAKSLIYSLQFRKAFGGMAGDKVLIDCVTRSFYERFMNPGEEMNRFWIELLTENSISNTTNILDYATLPNLELHEWIIPAIDFHPMPNILTMLMDKFEDYEYDEIKETIWHFSSKYTNKRAHHLLKIDYVHKGLDSKVFQRDAEIWNKIRGQFYGIAEFFLKNSY